MRRVFVALALLLALPSPGRTGPAESYRDALAKRCSQYRSAKGRLAPVYPALAKQIVQDYEVKKGICVDMGSGTGPLAFALAKITDLTVYALDIDPVAVRLCNVLADEAKMTGRVRAIEGDAQNMPFRDNFADLVVSRGSIFFWPDQLAGVKEAYRILKPGGVAYLGGGFSRLLAPIEHQCLAGWKIRNMDQLQKGGWRPLDKQIVERAQAAGIAQIRLIRETDNVGWWLEIRKPATQY